MKTSRSDGLLHARTHTYATSVRNSAVSPFIDLSICTTIYKIALTKSAFREEQRQLPWHVSTEYHVIKL